MRIELSHNNDNSNSSDNWHDDTPTPADLPMKRKRRKEKTPMWVMVFLIGTIALAGVGFVFKLAEFIKSWVTTSGADFAIVPVATYLAVSAGYLCFFVWAFRRGMFTDIEAPKYRMLEMQDEIDARGGRIQ